MISNDKWITIEAAAKYLGIGKTKLYELAQSGKIPASKSVNKWVFSKEKLDEWLQASKSIENFFLNLNPNIENNDLLREPQREGYLRANDFFSKGGKQAIIQIPVGCGKTGLISLLPLNISKGRVLVIAPNLTIKEELYRNLDITNRQKCFWRKVFVLEEKDMVAGPYVCSLDEGNVSISESSHIIVTNIQQLATNTDKWLNQFKDDFFDMIIVDEGHHSAATSWKKVFEKFSNAKIINLTATPFRSDRQDLPGELIYRYSFKSASIKGYIKKLTASYVAPSELTFTVKGEEKTYTLQEVLKMKEETWFSRGVALSQPCNVNIVENSLEKLEKLRLSGTKHQIIAVACSIRHAEQIRSLYSERGYNAEVIHSKMDEDEKIRVIRDLTNGTLDCIVQVQMLGEGFDHPKLSVAAIFNPFRSLAPYIQFVGRILRVIVQNDPTHPDNYGYIVTHLGLNLDQQLKRFKEFENDDQSFWEEVTGGKEPEPPHEVIDGTARLRFGEEMVVSREIIDSVFEEDFATMEDKDIIAELEHKLKNLGLNPKLAKKIFDESQKIPDYSMRRTPNAQPFSILPQRQWAEAKKRLNEEAKRTAKLVLNNCNLEMQGMEVPYKYKLGTSARGNFVAILELVNKRVNKLIGEEKEREQWTLAEFQKAMDEFPNILNSLVREIKKAQSNYAEG